MSGGSARRDWVERVLKVRIPSPGGVDFAPALKQWQAVQARVRADMAAFGKALLADPAIAKDTRLPFVKAAVAELPKMLPSPGKEVTSLLSGKAASADEVMAALATYRTELAGVRQLARLEAFAGARLKTPLTVRETLTSALDEIEQTLRNAA